MINSLDNMPALHKNLANGKWQKLSFNQQMANIASEVSRTIKWKENNEPQTAQQCFWRAVELIDLTIASQTKKSRILETARLKEVFCDYFLDKKNYKTKPETLVNYLMPFAFLT